MAPMLSITRRVWAAMSPSIIPPVAGSRWPWPDTKSMLPARTPWEYGPIACGASFVLIAVRMEAPSGGLDDLARAEAARAHPHVLRAAVHLHLHALKVRLEAAGRHVVRVADLAAHDRALVANLTAFGHGGSPGVPGGDTVGPSGRDANP